MRENRNVMLEKDFGELGEMGQQDYLSTITKGVKINFFDQKLKGLLSTPPMPKEKR